MSPLFQNEANQHSIPFPSSARTTIDWTVRENIRANLCVLVNRILRKYGYPPDQQEEATLTVLEQVEVLSPARAITRSQC
jgi:chorismate mutase